MNKSSSGIDWNKVDAIPESEYDYDEAPEATLEFFRTASIKMPDVTRPVTIRLKTGTLDFFKQQSKHYQTFINSVLDAYVEAHKKGKIAH
jgi:uncharacterized protein (DUF4415 family)